MDACRCWFATDSSFGWVCKGRLLEVFSMQTGERWAAKRFGSSGVPPDIVKTSITAACQFGTAANATYLAVATAQDDFSCFRIYLFDVNRKAIVKAMQLPFVVCLTYLQFIDWHIFFDYTFCH